MKRKELHKTFMNDFKIEKTTLAHALDQRLVPCWFNVGPESYHSYVNIT